MAVAENASEKPEVPKQRTTWMPDFIGRHFEGSQESQTPNAETSETVAPSVDLKALEAAVAPAVVPANAEKARVALKEGVEKELEKLKTEVATKLDQLKGADFNTFAKNHLTYRDDDYKTWTRDFNVLLGNKDASKDAAYVAVLQVLLQERVPGSFDGSPYARIDRSLGAYTMQALLKFKGLTDKVHLDPSLKDISRYQTALDSLFVVPPDSSSEQQDPGSEQEMPPAAEAEKSKYTEGFDTVYAAYENFLKENFGAEALETVKIDEDATRAVFNEVLMAFVEKQKNPLGLPGQPEEFFVAPPAFDPVVTLAFGLSEWKDFIGEKSAQLLPDSLQNQFPNPEIAQEKGRFRAEAGKIVDRFYGQLNSSFQSPLNHELGRVQRVISQVFYKPLDSSLVLLETIPPKYENIKQLLKDYQVLSGDLQQKKDNYEKNVKDNAALSEQEKATYSNLIDRAQAQQKAKNQEIDRILKGARTQVETQGAVFKNLLMNDVQNLLKDYPLHTVKVDVALLKGRNVIFPWYEMGKIPLNEKGLTDFFDRYFKNNKFPLQESDFDALPTQVRTEMGPLFPEMNKTQMVQAINLADDLHQVMHIEAGLKTIKDKYSKMIENLTPKSKESSINVASAQ